MNARIHHAGEAAERSVWLNPNATAHEQLGLLPNHTPEARTQAVRDALKRWHPDRPGGSTDIFLAVKQARAVINDTLLRDQDAERFAERRVEREREIERQKEGDVATQRHSREDALRAAGIYGGAHVTISDSRLNPSAHRIAPWLIPTLCVVLVSGAGAYIALKPKTQPPCATASSLEMQRALNRRDQLQEQLQTTETQTTAIMTRLNGPASQTRAENEQMLKDARDTFQRRDQQRAALKATEQTIRQLNCQPPTEPL